MNYFIYEDPGDKYDKVKWDFDETKLYDNIKFNNHEYKILKSTTNKNKVLYIFSLLRLFTDKICVYMNKNKHKFPKLSKNIDIFLKIHMKNNGKNYIIGQIPNNMGFYGLNKPKKRYISKEPNVGKDKNLRCKRRHIFLSMMSNEKELIDLYIHEISHTGCNHLRWREDDHGKDFKDFENFIQFCASKI